MFDPDFFDAPEVLAAQARNEAREAAERAAWDAVAAARRAARAEQPRPGSRRIGDRYAGVVRRGRATLAECGHEHTNRDWTTSANGTSATDCARAILAGAANPTTAEHHADRLRRSWERLTSGAGFSAPAATIEAAKVASSAAADSYLAAVATVRTLTD